MDLKYEKVEGGLIYSKQGTDINKDTGELTKSPYYKNSKVQGGIDDCKRACNRFPQCRGFSRSKDGDECWLKSKDGVYNLTFDKVPKYDTYRQIYRRPPINVGGWPVEPVDEQNKKVNDKSLNVPNSPSRVFGLNLRRLLSRARPIRMILRMIEHMQQTK